MKKHYLPVAMVAIIAILIASSFAIASSSTPNAEPGVESKEVTVTAVLQYRTVDFASPGYGRCAIFLITVGGYGVLQVDTADYNPTVWPDYWRATITVVNTGTGSLLTETVSSSVGLPRAPPTYTGVAEMPVYSGLYIKVLISWDRGKTPTSTLWPATCYIRFRYTGPSMTITGPLAGF